MCVCALAVSGSRRIGNIWLRRVSRTIIISAHEQFSYERSIGVDDGLLERGRGTEGESVVQRNAAKCKHNAGPE